MPPSCWRIRRSYDSCTDDPVVTIEETNINHADSARLVYNVFIKNATTSEVGENLDKLKMHFWTTEPAAANATPGATVQGYVDTTKTHEGGVWVFFESYDIAPKAMTNSVYCAAEYNGTYSDVFRYSVFEYLCEAALDASTAQNELYEAMKDYILYAQMYLGVDGTEFPSPDSLAYIKLTNAYILVNDEKVRDGVVPMAKYTIYSDYTYARYVNHSGSYCQFADGYINTWNAYFSTSKQSLGYTAYEAGQITFDPVADSQVVRVEKSGNSQGNTNWDIVKTYTGAGEFTLCEDYSHNMDYFFVVPVEPEGKIFSHWEIDGVKVSESYMYSINDNTEWVTGESVAATMPTPIFADEAVYKTHSFNTLDAQTSDTTTTAEVTDDEGNVIGYTNVKTASGGGQYNDFTCAAVEGTEASKQIRFTQTVNISSAAGDYDNPLITDFFSNNGFAQHYQNHLYLGDANIMQYAFYANFDSAKAKTSGYYVRLAGDISGNSQVVDFNATIMEYGVDNTLEFIIDLGETDGAYEITNITLYVNGNFAGSTVLHTTVSPTFAYAESFKLRTYTVSRTISTLTMTNVSVVEYK